MTQNSINHFGSGGVSFSGPKAVDLFQCAAVAVALEAYASHKMLMNRHYTPTRMLAFANRMTGHLYRRGQYTAAALALREHVERLRAEIHEEMAQ